MPPELVAWLVVGFVAVIALHEATHVLIARSHGHPMVCIAVNPIGVAVVFEDSPRAPYWLSQVTLPAAVTWVASYVWLHVLVTYPSGLQMRLPAGDPAFSLPLFVTLLTVLTSAGDIFSAIKEIRAPLWGEERVHRDFAMLRRIPNLIMFTAHGRRRWRDVWAGRVT
jgi:hypothetical protein